MIAATPIVVHVVDSGPDWASIAAAAATFLAAAIGIAGTSWQAKRGRESASDDLNANLTAATRNLRLGIKADAARARRADKRQLYASCLAAFTAMPRALIADRAARATDDIVRIERKHEETQRAMTTMDNAVAELELIASAEVIRLANQTARFYYAYLDQTDAGTTLLAEWPTDIEEGLPQLSAAMRADLAEEPLPADTEPAGPAETGGPEPEPAPA